MDDALVAVLKINAELTKQVVELSRELAGLRSVPVPAEVIPMETRRLFLTEEEEDEEFANRDAVKQDVADLLDFVGAAPNVEFVD